MKISKSLLLIALAATSSAVIAADAERMSADPTVFVMKAAQGGMTEVEAGRVALSKSQDPTVRMYAQRMVDDHGKANAELSRIAEAKGMDVPKELDAEHQGMVDALSMKSGSEFDREYSQHMKMDHSKTIALFESATKTSDMELAGFAKKTLPTLKEHKKMAEKLPGKGAPSAGL